MRLLEDAEEPRPGDLVEWIKRELAVRGWSQAELSQRSGIGGPQISRVLSGLSGPGMDFYRGVAQAFGVSLETVFRLAGLIGETGEPDELPLTPDVAALVEKLNRLPADKRREIVAAIEKLVDITYIVQPWESYTQDERERAKLAALFEAMQREGFSAAEIQRMIEERYANGGARQNGTA